MNKNSILCLFLLLAVLFLTSGRASIFCGLQKATNIKSNPAGTQFSIIDKKGEMVTQETTPTIVTLKHGSGYFATGDYTITIDKPDYVSAKMPIKQGVEWGWYAGGNIIFGGLTGWFNVDPLTGGMYNIEDVNIELYREGSALLQDRKIPFCYIPQSTQTLILRRWSVSFQNKKGSEPVSTTYFIVCPI